MSIEFTNEDFFEISRRLENYHTIFYKFWELGKPTFTNKVERYAVSFDSNGEFLNLLFNPEFWKNATDKQKEFSICHECLHVILNHGYRMTQAKDELSKMITDIASDLVVNHLLVNNFLFIRKEADPENQLFWIDTVFGENSNVPDNESFEYYYNLLNQLPEDDLKQLSSSGSCQDGENHQPSDGQPDNESESDSPGQSEFPFGMNQSQSAQTLDSLKDYCSEAEFASFGEMIQDKIENEKEFCQMAGTSAGNMFVKMSDEKVKRKKKWETVIKKWYRKFMKNEFDLYEHWARVDKRSACLPQDIILPCDMEIDEKEDQSKIDVAFFLDTSGSCCGYANRFWKAAMSIPKERFNLKLYCFDTRTYEVDIKEKKLYGFGGTYFHIIENRIQEDIKNKKLKSYPKAVFIITDGYGSIVQPEKPKNWYWFLTPYNYKGCIPKESKTFELSQFE